MHVNMLELGRVFYKFTKEWSLLCQCIVRKLMDQFNVCGKKSLLLFMSSTSCPLKQEWKM